MTWNQIVATLPAPHFLQTSQWAHIKAPLGWRAYYALWKADGSKAQIHPTPPQLLGALPAAAALILERSVNIGGFAAPLRMLYAPKAPLLRNWDDAHLRQRVLDDLEGFARSRRAMTLKLDPDVPLGRGIPAEAEAAPNPLGQTYVNELQARGWHFSNEQIQFRNTVLIDLAAPEDELLARMKQKTRYNIRLAERKGVRVRPAEPAEYPLLTQIYAETARRDGFLIRETAYYLRVWQTFAAAGMLTPLLAQVEGEPVAGLILFHFGGRAWYVYGMSREVHREKMPTYLLQWEAMRRAKALGCREYDLWGAPDVFDESDRMWGVFRFKQGLGGTVLRTPGAYDYAPSAFWYGIYTRVLPRLVAVLRRRAAESPAL
ncbi:MAG: peptidoglycan bridge formation glycyltransferase FemA/FemB family protein [Anaerolineales bacterium]